MQSVERFSSRVENYVRYRPGYPEPIIHLLHDECGLTPESVIADIGSGTGKLSELLLQNGNVVFGVEPNAAMRAAGEALLASYPSFRSAEGTAEATTLSPSSVDFVVAGQAFHWFDPIAAKEEFTRILKPGGWAVLIWNERQVDTTPFLRAYEQLLLTLGTDYPVVRHENASAAITSFFAPAVPKSKQMPNSQEFDLSSLEGRLLSSSYTPEAGDPRFEAMLERVREIFDQYQEGGIVRFEYVTRIFYNQIK
ncbi:MAG TPA: class I SAM-dependent methyltransferase [Pyrinomonadaceae bacterium]|jgi:SAM-dependent methyltransferase